MPVLEIYDPPMCCATGVCGVEVDPRLTQLVSDLNFLKGAGIEVRRFNLKDHVQAFAQNPKVIAEMGAENEFLPIFIWDGQIVCKGAYPSREQLSKWTGAQGTEQKSSGSCCSGQGCCG